MDKPSPNFSYRSLELLVIDGLFYFAKCRLLCHRVTSL
jgi:hypothetical protein